MLYTQFEHNIRWLAIIGHIHSALLSVDVVWKAAESRNEIHSFLYPVIRLLCHTPSEDMSVRSILGTLRSLWMARHTQDQRAGALLLLNIQEGLMCFSLNQGSQSPVLPYMYVVWVKLITPAIVDHFQCHGTCYVLRGITKFN